MERSLSKIRSSWRRAGRPFGRKDLRFKSLPISDCQLPTAGLYVSDDGEQIGNWQSEIGNYSCASFPSFLLQPRSRVLWGLKTRSSVSLMSAIIQPASA